MAPLKAVDPQSMPRPAWRLRLEDDRPALTVLEVAGLVDDEARVAVEAVALV